MAASEEYFYDGAWRTYSELYNGYGITLEPSTPITLYDLSLQQYKGWVDKNNNTWIVRDNRWYSPSDLPYYRKLTTPFRPYLIERQLQLDAYELRSDRLYDYGGALHSYDFMHNGYGITLTPSRVYYVKDGLVKCWYNPDINLYWVVDDTVWQPDPPDYSGGGSGDAPSSSGLFFFTNRTNTTIEYGTIVDGSLLKPVCISVPLSGEITYTITANQASGSWKLLTTVPKSLNNIQCLVLAAKLSEDEPVTQTDDNSQNNTNNTNSVSPNYTEIIEYNL